MKHPTVGKWGSVFLPTDIDDPATGEPLYVWAKVRPRWYWHWRRLSLFLGIVWRPCWGAGRLDWRTAWEVARGVYAEQLGGAE